MRMPVLVGAVALGLFAAYTFVAGQEAVPNLAADKTMFWSAADVQARWKENERIKRINSRLFNGPTNISANVRIVLPGDEPQTHDTTADLWIVTEGSATAETDGAMVKANGTTTINNGVRRAVHPGDVLYVPPGVPHHFSDMQAFRAWLIRFDTAGLVRSKPAPQTAPMPDVAADKTTFWTAADINARWRENEEKKRINSRIFNGPANISANVRIVLPGDEPQTHVETADLWLVMAGGAVARTDGQIVDENGKKTIRNAAVRNVHPGDVLYVPPGVPHHFTDMNGFRAWLIRFDVDGWTQPQSAAGGQAVR